MPHSPNKDQYTPGFYVGVFIIYFFSHKISYMFIYSGGRRKTSSVSFVDDSNLERWGRKNSSNSTASRYN